MGSSDLTINRTTSPPISCYSCKVTVILAGTTFLVLGVLMLTKVTVLPERLFKENITLEKTVKWGTLALGIILGTSGMSMLSSQSEPDLQPNLPSTQPTSNTSKQTTSQDGLDTSTAKPDTKAFHDFLKNNEITEAIHAFSTFHGGREEQEEAIIQWINQNIAIPEKQKDILRLVDILSLTSQRDEVIRQLFTNSLPLADINTLANLVSKMNRKRKCINIAIEHYLTQNQFFHAYQFITSQPAKLIDLRCHIQLLEKCLKQQKNVVASLSEITSKNIQDPLIKIIFMFPKGAEKDVLLFALFGNTCTKENLPYLSQLRNDMSYAGCRKLDDLVLAHKKQILQEHLSANRIDDFYHFIIEITKSAPPQMQLLEGITPEISTFIAHLFTTKDTDKLYTIVLALYGLPGSSSKNNIKLIEIFLDNNDIAKVVTLAEDLSDTKDSIRYIKQAIQYCLDHNLPLPQPKLFRSSWHGLQEISCREILEAFFAAPDYSKSEQILRIIPIDTLNCLTNLELLMDNYKNFPPDKQKSLFFLRILAHFVDNVNKSGMGLPIAKEHFQRLPESLSTFSSADDIRNAIDKCGEDESIKKIMRKIFNDLK